MEGLRNLGGRAYIGGTLCVMLGHTETWTIQYYDMKLCVVREPRPVCMGV